MKSPAHTASVRIWHTGRGEYRVACCDDNGEALDEIFCAESKQRAFQKAKELADRNRATVFLEKAGVWIPADQTKGRPLSLREHLVRGQLSLAECDLVGEALRDAQRALDRACAAALANKTKEEARRAAADARCGEDAALVEAARSKLERVMEAAEQYRLSDGAIWSTELIPDCAEEIRREIRRQTAEADRHAIQVAKDLATRLGGGWEACKGWRDGSHVHAELRCEADEEVSSIADLEGRVRSIAVQYFEGRARKEPFAPEVDRSIREQANQVTFETHEVVANGDVVMVRRRSAWGDEEGLAWKWGFYDPHLSSTGEYRFLSVEPEAVDPDPAIAGLFDDTS